MPGLSRPAKTMAFAMDSRLAQDVRWKRITTTELHLPESDFLIDAIADDGKVIERRTLRCSQAGLSLTTPSFAEGRHRRRTTACARPGPASMPPVMSPAATSSCTWPPTALSRRFVDRCPQLRKPSEIDSDRQRELSHGQDEAHGEDDDDPKAFSRPIHLNSRCSLRDIWRGRGQLSRLSALVSSCRRLRRHLSRCRGCRGGV